MAALASSAKMAHANEQSRSTNYLGMVGLNTIPSARMDKEGTVRAGASTLDPYNHAFLGMQIAKPLYVNLRQSMLISSVGDKPMYVYPGMDFKLRLKEEGRYAPEIAFGMDSALGHKRFSSEYFALSKRVYDFDFTAGFAWGRMGSAGHIPNPLARISSHFDKDRDYNDENAAGPRDWFTGKDMGFFGGVEYFTPIKGLSLKADFGADSYPGEQRSFDFDAPATWSAGINYSPKPWFGFGAGVVGGDKVMVRLSLQDKIFDWFGKSNKDSKPFKFDAKRPDHTWRNLPREMAAAEDIYFGKTRVKDGNFSGVLHMNDYTPSAQQIGRAARHLAANAGPEIETITVIPVTSGIRGKAVTFSRRDLEQAIAQNQGSPEEIWQDVQFSTDTRSISTKTKTRKYKFFPELSFSIGEEETTHLYRAALAFEERKEWNYGFLTGSSARLNLADNLHRLFKFKELNTNTVRGDADLFTMNRINLDRAFLSWMHTVRPDVHVALTAGYLEEMYAGYGGEILYRPFDSPFAIGAEAWSAYKRDGLSPLALDFYNDPALTGHLNLYYDIPDTDITAFAKVGRFLGGDNGVSAGAERQFDSGLKVKGFITATNSNDKDVFNSDRNVYGGFQISLPLGNLKFIPEGSAARVNIAPIGRDDGQVLNKPVSLYDVTEPMSYRHLGRNWQSVTD